MISIIIAVLISLATGTTPTETQKDKNTSSGTTNDQTVNSLGGTLGWSETGS
ncbi:hypothetical protein [Pontibacter ummariensis]|uniref:hypothetical protein n=1 Tax=Pontibacter ummariensis TaxID=1610492 RepID=UPI0015E5B2D4|nr:hypothetical protein [Pontibacter ummariensis]